MIIYIRYYYSIIQRTVHKEFKMIKIKQNLNLRIIFNFECKNTLKINILYQKCINKYVSI